MKKKIAVGILGATGVIGEAYLNLLRDHPWFEVTLVCASEKRVGTPSPINIAYTALEDIALAKKRCRLIFSALPSTLSFWEERYAQTLPLLSHASTHRMKKEVPLVIPEINPSHLDLLQERNSEGFILVKPNCALFSFLLPLAPLHSHFPIKKIMVTTLQAISGAGIKALSAMEMHNNIIPHIPQEEEKLENEPLKILGQWDGSTIVPASIVIAAQCTRVPVLHGHFACVSVAFEKKPKKEEIIQLWKEFAPLKLPASPAQVIDYQEDEYRPQTRLDLQGMGVSVGRLRPCPLMDYRFVGLSHNAIRGGAGGGVLLAELLYTKGLLA